MSATLTQPTVSLRIAESAIAYDEGGEVVETVDFNEDGTPDWTNAGICDFRGAGGEQGYRYLVAALDACEANAVVIGDEVVRVPQA